MSELRIFGLLCALIAFFIVSFRLRKTSSNRFDVWVFITFGLIMMFVSLFPGLINLPSEILSLDKHERDRLLTLLILSNVALWFLIIYERSKTRYNAKGFDILVRKLAVEAFFEKPVHDILPDSILIVIPAYNEANNLEYVLRSIPGESNGYIIHVLVVDDGSTDETATICQEQDTLYARNIINRGGGAALRVGFDIAKILGVKIIVNMDGDGQHIASDLDNLIGPIINNESDLVIGSRILGSMEKYSALRYFGVIFFGKLISAFVGYKISDPASGFRAFNQRVIQSCAFTQDQYYSAELIIEAIKIGLIIKEMPITIKQRHSGISKKEKDWKYALFFFRTIVKSWLK